MVAVLGRAMYGCFEPFLGLNRGSLRRLKLAPRGRARTPHRPAGGFGSNAQAGAKALELGVSEMAALVQFR
jgi:hypothetical protein